MSIGELFLAITTAGLGAFSIVAAFVLISDHMQKKLSERNKELKSRK
jgi:hypothetical protein